MKLFNRLASGYQLTADGQLIAERARGLEAEIVELQKIALCEERPFSGLLRIAAPDNDLFDLAASCATFSSRYPTLQLDIQFGSDSVNLTQLQSDVAIRLTNTPDELLVGRELGKVKYRPYVHRDLLAKLGAGAMERYPWVSWSGTDGSAEFDRWLRAQSTQLRVAATTNSEPAALALVKAGIGAAYLPVAMVGEVEELCVLPIKPACLELGIWVLVHRDLRHVDKVKAFVNFITDELRRQII